MESFSSDIRTILQELNQSELKADELISTFKKGFDEVVQKYVLSKNTPTKPSKKKAKGRLDKQDCQDDSLSSTNSSRNASTITRTTVQNDNQSIDEEPQLMRPVRTGRAKATCYKEPALNTKMRRDDTMSVTKIKVERVSTDGAANQSKTTTSTASTSNTVRIKKEKVDEPADQPANSSSESKAKKTPSDDLNDSLEIVALETSPTIELSDDEDTNDGNKMPPPAFVPPAKAVKEKKAPVEKKTRSTRSKQTKRKIKQEPASESEDESVASSSSTVVANAEAKAATKNSSDTTKTIRTFNTSGESLYEDAMSQPSNRQLPLSQQSDATFVTTTEETELLSPRGTYIIPKDAGASDATNATFNVAQSTGNAKRVINKAVNSAAASKISASSLMTEDDSDSDSGAKKYTAAAKSKNAKELFNPCAPKPIKQRVEAFEKLQTPQKETRTRARVVTCESEKLKSTHSLLAKSSSSEQIGKHIRANSATRYGQSAQKPGLSKSQSVEEIRKKTQAVADEKKKKQDDKLRKAQQLREAQEKEKADKQRKLLLEKEQRAKEKAQQKQQEEMLRMQEQKRKEAERDQKRKEALAKKAAAEKKEQEHYLRVLAEKKAMQEQLKQNKMKAEEMRKKNAYNFDMLESGDSTDDEGKASTKRPTPPQWSTSQNRYNYVMAQARVSTKITDKFFSVAPHEVDLREIFPSIDEKYLRRNSSAVWKSPPRYSLLPKY